MKKLVVCLSLLLVMSGMMGCAEEFHADGFVYQLNQNGDAIICGFVSEKDTDTTLIDIDQPVTGNIYKPTGNKGTLEIPDMLDGHPVVSIGDGAFAGDLSFSRVVIPAAIKNIGNEAFISCNELFVVELTEGVQHIGYNAFAYTEISEVRIPSSVREITGNPFNGCDFLTEILVEAGNECFYTVQDVLFNRITETLVSYPSGKKETEYIVPEGTIVIGEYAFCGCKLTSIYLPYSIKVIEPYAFAFSRDLEMISVPYTMSMLNESAFSWLSRTFRFQIRSNFTMLDWAEAYGMEYDKVIEKAEN